MKRSVNMTFNKYFFIYYLVLSINIRLIFSVRHQDFSKESSILTTGSTVNSVNSKIHPNESFSSEEDLEENDDEDFDNVHYSSAEIRKRYENQHNIFSKKSQDKSTHTNLQSNSSTERKIKLNTCSSDACIARKDVEAANTESIRKHILMKLGIDEEKLNHTLFPKLNERLIEGFCRNNKISLEICMGRKAEPTEYQLDSPDDISYDEFEEDHDTSIESGENVKFLSFENRIYAFPSSKYIKTK